MGARYADEKGGALTGRFMKIGIFSAVAAAVLAVIDIYLASIPLTLFFLLFLIAPFTHRFGLFLPVVSRGRRDVDAVALTFDDGPDPHTTPALLDLLERHHVRATFFVIGRRAEQYPELIGEIARRQHTIGNHGYSHDEWAAFKGDKKVFEEIATAQRVLSHMGVAPKLFRPPVGITYPAMQRALAALNLITVTFSCQAWDRGNRSIDNLSRKILKRARPGDIIMLHDKLPRHKKQYPSWLREVSIIVEGLKKKGLKIVTLSELTGIPLDENGSLNVQIMNRGTELPQ